MYFIEFIKKTPLAILLLLAFPSESFGQDFKWVYNIIGRQTELFPHPHSEVSDVVMDNYDNIYVAGKSIYKNDFSNGTGNIIIDTQNSLSFIAKLDKNRNVLWAKHFHVPENVRLDIIKLYVDHNQNLLLAGNVKHTGAPPFIDIGPDPGEQQTIINPSAPLYGIVIKLDSFGNYLSSRHIENFQPQDIACDSNNDIIVTGVKITYTNPFLTQYYLTGAIFKFNNNLNNIWTKYLDGSSNSLGGFAIDNDNNLIIIGYYYNSLNFAGENLQKEHAIFTCKLDPDGNEEWILDQETAENPNDYALHISNRPVVDNNNFLYLSSSYWENSIYHFKNTSISDLPTLGHREAILFRLDIHGNYLSHFTFSGIADQDITSFAISSFDELFIGLKTGGKLFFNNSNGSIASFSTEGENILIKMNSSHELIDYKETDHRIGDLQFDSNNNIITGGTFHKDTDFDPHPINEYIVRNNNMRSGYVLKLSYCQTYPPTGDNAKIFCSDDNATIADLEINDYNVSWYASLNSTVPLNNTTLLVDGQTYYAAKNKIDHCPEIAERLAVAVTINPTPPAPTLNANQPCFNNNMRLSNLIIEGTNLAFYSSATSTVKLNTSTLIIPENTYYVSQVLDGCESLRTAISIPELSIVNLNDHTINLCDRDKNNYERINLSNYISSILNDSANNYTISYHTSQADAINNTSPILDYLDYKASNQTVYIRFVSNQYSCFEIAQLIINLSSPPEITDIITSDGTNYSNSVTVLPFNPEHLYSIDGINYQGSNTFENVPAGEHFVYVKDKEEACGEVKDNFYLLVYPKFFTPNGDGFNDFWKIKYASFQFSVDVEIYDRYGKLITSFDKNSPGWDGTYNGEKLPATDYWFKVTRLMDREIIHRGHFSLKR